MATKLETSTKRIAISKAQAQTVAVTAVAAFVIVFCLIAANSLRGTYSYQSRVISAEKKAHTQLQANLQAVNKLSNAYQAFVDQPTNVIGGSSSGTGNNQGDNATIILDALPSQYDFPALTSSLEKIFDQANLTVSSIGGTDDEVAQQANTDSANPQPVPMPFNFTVTNANYTSVQNLISTLQRSIRPMVIDSLTLSGGSDDMQLTVNAHTYYQPAKKYQVKTETVQ